MVAHVPESRTVLESEVDRYIADPGQATAYMIGRLEIERLRKEAENRLGKNFDIREFHDHVLENGSVPLPFLRDHIEAWRAGKGWKGHSPLTGLGGWAALEEQGQRALCGKELWAGGQKGRAQGRD